MQTQFLEEDFTLRSQTSYDRECTDIEEAPTDTVRNDLCTTYGINKRSALCNLPDFDITKQLPQDIMHTLLEGTVQYEVRLVILTWERLIYFSLSSTRHGRKLITTT